MRADFESHYVSIRRLPATTHSCACDDRSDHCTHVSATTPKYQVPAKPTSKVEHARTHERKEEVQRLIVNTSQLGEPCSHGVFTHRVVQSFLQVSPTIDFSLAAICLTLLDQ
ncbi:hypothetical protein DF147_15300 [Burkholderia cenocepacia]|nr:hypothetical protein DF147_15300 [Burkholderia cenocepacia]RSB88067.1 hypothetical protein EGT47_04410 [Burkholderia cenocepacia]